MQTQPIPDYRFEEYLAVERDSTEVRLEYVAGQVFAMTGGSYEHSLTGVGGCLHPPAQ